MFFKTLRNAYIVNGKKRSCIYNLLNGEILELSNDDITKIMQLDNGVPIESINQLNMDLIHNLEEKGLGEIYTRNNFIDKYRQGLPQNIKNSSPEKIIVDSLYLQINSSCNINCYFCNEDTFVNRTTGCKKWNISSNVTIEKYRELLFASFKVGCKKLHLMGGEPLLNKDLYYKILDLAKQIGYKDIFVYTNGLLIDKETINKSTDVNYVIHIVAHTQALLNDIHSGEEININILEQNIKLLQNSSVPFYFSVCLCSKNYKHINEINNYLTSFNAYDITYGYIYEDMINEDYKKIVYANLETSKSAWDCNTFFHKSEHHPCMYGKLSIFQNGDITVCPMMKDEVIANINETSIFDLLQRKLQNKYWNLSSNKIEHCKDCGYRLACTDCRAIEKSATNNLFGKRYCNDL